MARLGRSRTEEVREAEEYAASPERAWNQSDQSADIAVSWDEPASEPQPSSGSYEDNYQEDEEEVSTETVDTANGIPELKSETETATPTANGKPARGRPKLESLPDVPIDALTAEDVPESEWASTPLSAGPSRERDAVQLKVDADVKTVYDAWVTAEKPNARQAPRKRYIVAPEHAPKTRAMLTNAGTHLKVRVIQTKSHQPDGKVAIVFSAIDREPKKK